MKLLTRLSTRWSSTGGGGGGADCATSHSGISKGTAMRPFYERSHVDTYYGQWPSLFPSNAPPEKGGQCPSGVMRAGIIHRRLWIVARARTRLGQWPGSGPRIREGIVEANAQNRSAKAERVGCRCHDLDPLFRSSLCQSTSASSRFARPGNKRRKRSKTANNGPFRAVIRAILHRDSSPVRRRDRAARHATPRGIRQRPERTLDDAAADAVAAEARIERQGRGEWCFDLVRGVRERLAGRAAARWAGELELLGRPGAGAGRDAPGDRDRQPRPRPQHAQRGALRLRADGVRRAGRDGRARRQAGGARRLERRGD